MHLPEKWGMLQFADGAVNATAPAWNAEWPVRAAAAAVYYAEHAYAAAHNGSYTAAIADLAPFLAAPAIVDGTCNNGVPVALRVAFNATTNASSFVATVPPSSAGSAAAAASITDERLLLVSG